PRQNLAGSRVEQSYVEIPVSLPIRDTNIAPAKTLRRYALAAEAQVRLVRVVVPRVFQSLLVRWQQMLRYARLAPGLWHRYPLSVCRHLSTVYGSRGYTNCN